MPTPPGLDGDVAPPPYDEEAPPPNYDEARPGPRITRLGIPHFSRRARPDTVDNDASIESIRGEIQRLQSEITLLIGHNFRVDDQVEPQFGTSEPERPRPTHRARPDTVDHESDVQRDIRRLYSDAIMWVNSHREPSVSSEPRTSPVEAIPLDSEERRHGELPVWPPRTLSLNVNGGRECDLPERPKRKRRCHCAWPGLMCLLILVAIVAVVVVACRAPHVGAFAPRDWYHSSFSSRGVLKRLTLSQALLYRRSSRNLARRVFAPRLP